MGLETGTYISDLNSSNPVGASDPKSQGDDHLRLIKATLLATFPNITGALSSTHTELNYLTGVTGTTGTGKLVLDTAPTLGAVTATSYDGIAAANLVDKSAAETITGAWDLGVITATSYGGITEANLVDKSAAETITGAWDFGVITATSYDGILATNLLSEIAAIDTTVANTSAAQPGYKGAPQNIQNANYTLVLTDAGKQIYKASGGAGETITIPANASVAFPVGTIVEIINDGGGSLSIAITTDTLEKFGGSAGTQTLGDNNKAVIEKVTSTLWKYASTD